MKQAIINVLNSMCRIFDEGLHYLLDRNLDRCISPIGKQILSNKTDKDNYLKAINEADKTGKNVTFQLHTGEEITVLPSRR